MFKRYIDDILYITIEDGRELNIKDALTNKFQEYNLELSFKEISTTNQQDKLEFLDVMHVITSEGKGGFKIKDFVKPTARNATFLHVKSYHPKHMFSGIILSEGKRLRRLNEEDLDYKISIERLEEKCRKSNFQENIINEYINKIKTWKRNDIESSDETPIEEKTELRG